MHCLAGKGAAEVVTCEPGSPSAPVVVEPRNGMEKEACKPFMAMT